MLINRVTNSLTLAVSLLALSGCAGADPLTGTWRQPDGSTPLPAAIAEGDLLIDATLVMDGAASPGTFQLTMDLEYSALMDTVDLHGTYVAAGGVLTMEISEIDPGTSGNVVSMNEASDPCIALTGFGGAQVCFPRTQSHDYTLASDVLTIVVDNAIAGTPGPTTLMLSRVP